MRALRKLVLGMGAICMTLGLTGCFETATLLKVNKDGSGVLVVREFFSPQITSSADGFGGLGDFSISLDGEAGDAVKTAPKPKKVDFFADALEKKKKSLGDVVKLVENKTVVNKSGWKGYQAKFSFDDVTKLKLNMDMDDSGMGGASSGSSAGFDPFSDDAGSSDAADADAGEEEKEDKTEYTFAFEKGNVATLKIIPLKNGKPIKAAEAQAAVETKPDPDAAAFDEIESTGSEPGPEAAFGQALGGGMMAMMGPMFKGMRMSMLIQVEGEIVETDSNYKSEKLNNLITYIDMPVDLVMAHPQAAALMDADNKGSLAQIGALDIPGTKLKDGERQVTIKFK